MTLTINTIDGKSFTTECTEDEYNSILLDCALSVSVVLKQNLTKQHIFVNHIASLIITKE